ncbi:hypothetical protein JQS43_25200 [Natronosporangium hydrolyticum]|uniref:Uncharacterized protein n=1 Tax=Natronosporangium hydrolyticum TaxID=2811111 RepID=A0A895YH48_9ACTN|nr:hypothetical protein [Natronosporangium hydrolyticum]QSB14713.1 hypothetical protein JQS43_25200 [Natronosporangium hydrolyticum]
MGFVQKAKCKLGFHIFDWQRSADPATPCRFESDCSACDRSSAKVEHDLPPWSPSAADPCFFTRMCRRCDHSEQRTDHAWAAPYFTEDYSCQREQICARCGEQQQVSPDHSYSYVYAADWRPRNPIGAAVNDLLEMMLKTSPGPCDQIYVCQRCDHQLVHRQRQEHQWSQWSQWSPQSAGQLRRFCGRCPAHEFRSA